MASAPQDDAREVELIGGIERRELVLVPYDASWTSRFQAERRQITEALGPTATLIEHIGSTAVPGLAAKPIIDVLVTVESIADEARYLPHLVSAGYQLRVRELGHRLFARSTSVSTSTCCSTTTTTRRRPTSTCATGSAGAR